MANVDKNDMEKRIREEEDYIKAPKYGNSLNKFLAKNDNLLEDGAIGRLLLLSKEEVEAIYLESIEILKKEMINEEGVE